VVGVFQQVDLPVMPNGHSVRVIHLAVVLPLKSITLLSNALQPSSGEESELRKGKHKVSKGEW